MRRLTLGTRLLLILGLSAGALTLSCAPPPGPPKAEFAPSALKFHLTAAPGLNTYDGRPHPLVLCVYQLTSPSAFEDRLQEPGGPNRLLLCEAFDPTVSGRKRVIVQPGETKDVVMDRAEGTRYVGIIAGYYERRPGAFYRVVPVPVVERTQGSSRR